MNEEFMWASAVFLALVFLFLWKEIKNQMRQKRQEKKEKFLASVYERLEADPRMRGVQWFTEDQGFLIFVKGSAFTLVYARCVQVNNVWKLSLTPGEEHYMYVSAKTRAEDLAQKIQKSKRVTPESVEMFFQEQAKKFSVAGDAAMQERAVQGARELREIMAQAAERHPPKLRRPAFVLPPKFVPKQAETSVEQPAELPVKQPAKQPAEPEPDLVTELAEEPEYPRLYVVEK